MKKLAIILSLGSCICVGAYAQDVINMETYPAKQGSVYQQFDAYQLDDSFSDVVTITELKVGEPVSLPIAVPPLGTYVPMQLKKLRGPSEPGLPAYDRKGKLTEEEETRYPEKTFYIIMPQTVDRIYKEE